MSIVSAIAQRELKMQLLTPGGCTILALFFVLCAIFFLEGALQQGEIASMRPVFDYSMWLLLFIAPAMTMRSLSDEYRMGTIESLMTSPVTETQVILGKFLGSVLFMLVLLLPSIVFVMALEIHGRPDYGELLCGYVGMILLGGSYLGTGILLSAITSSQVFAYLLTLFFWIGLSLGAKLLPAYVPTGVADFIFACDPDYRVRDFAIGLFDSANLIYFLSLITMSLTLATLALRWRLRA